MVRSAGSRRGDPSPARGREAEPSFITVEPLAELLVAAPTEATVPYLIAVLQRNDVRNGCYAGVTENHILDALRQFGHPDVVREVLAKRQVTTSELD